MGLLTHDPPLLVDFSWAHSSLCSLSLSPLPCSYTNKVSGVDWSPQKLLYRTLNLPFKKAANNGTCCWKNSQSQKRKKTLWTAASMCLLTLDQTGVSRSENSTNHISSPWLPSCHSTKSTLALQRHGICRSCARWPLNQTHSTQTT